MLHDYVKMLDEIRSDVAYRVYYREKFINMANRLEEQIEYDYEKQLEKCRKKMKTKDNDIGEEALTLTVRRR